MKYSNSNKPLACIMYNSTCYKGTRTFNPKGILWHCTGANNPNLKRYVQPSNGAMNRDELLRIIGTNPNRNDWNHAYVEAGVNAWIGKKADGSVTTVQALPWNYRPWGCGSGSKGSCNDTHIQFEMCEDALIDRAYFNACYQEGVELTAYLCQMYNIDPKGTFTWNGVKVPTILCHNDSYKLGLGSGHADVYNWFNRFGKTMDDVRNDVAKLLSGGTTAPSTGTTTPTTTISKEVEFIQKIAPYVQQIAPKYGIQCNSAVIAQACLESAYGTSNKAKYHNYFGLKYRPNRVTCNSGTFTDSSKEQTASGSYIGISTQWYSFANMAMGVEGYFQFINIPNYSNLKGVTDPQKYLTNIRADGYATSLSYVTNVMNVVKKYNLTKYDKAVAPTPTPTPTKKIPSIKYAVKTLTAVLPDVKDGAVAGNGKMIVGIKVGADVGSVKYRVHSGGRWLPAVTGCDWSDYNNGYAGDDVNYIDAVQIYYTSDRNITDVYVAEYAAKPVGFSKFLPEIHDTNWERVDGDYTAGIFGQPIGEFTLRLVKA